MRHLDNAIIELLNRTDVLERRVAAPMCGKKMGDDPDERETEEQFLDWVALLQATKEK